MDHLLCNIIHSIDMQPYNRLYSIVSPKDETIVDDEDNTTDENNTQEEMEAKDTDDEEDEDDIDETTNVRKKHSKRNAMSDKQSKAKAIARRKKKYNIQFTFDADVRCSITIYYFCREEITPQV